MQSSNTENMTTRVGEMEIIDIPLKMREGYISIINIFGCLVCHMACCFSFGIGAVQRTSQYTSLAIAACVFKMTNVSDAILFSSPRCDMLGSTTSHYVVAVSPYSTTQVRKSYLPVDVT